MSTYDFHTLNHKDFEDLVRDLLQEEWSCTIESFKTGKDSGIDLRYSSSNVNQTAIVIQTKHWIRSTVNQLITHLTKVEYQKVVKLNPARYVVATSLSLTPKNKDDIVRGFSGRILSPGDIYDGDMLNAMLLKYPEIEKRHYKLWLTSISVMQAIVSNAVYGRSLFAEEAIKARIAMFVQTGSYNQAKNFLNDWHAILLKGEPGAGKTVIAQMLVCEHLANGFQLVMINESVREAEEMFQPETKQIFLFDDFLGSNYLEVLTGTNVDSAICTFIDRVVNTKNKRLVMTSRTTILNKAVWLSSKFQAHDIGRKSYEVNVSGYTVREKAKILYNHLCTFVPHEYYHKLHEEKSFWGIVSHKNYNPRLIEYVTKPSLMSDVSPEQYREYIQAALDSPILIWKQPYEVQTDDYGKMLLITLFTLPHPVESADLKDAYISRVEYEIKSGGHLRISNPFYSKVRELQDGFIHHLRSDHKEYYKFYNPSIADYLISYLSEDDTEIERVFAAIVYAEQLMHRFGNSKPIQITKGISSRILSLIRANQGSYKSLSHGSCTITVVYAYIELFPLDDVIEDVERLLPDTIRDEPDFVNMSLLLKVLHSVRTCASLAAKVKELWNNIVDWLMESANDRDDLDEIVALFEVYDMDYEQYLLGSKEHVKNNVDRVIDFMIDEHVLSGPDIDSITDLRKMREYIESAEEEYANYRSIFVPDEIRGMAIMTETQIEEKVQYNIERDEEMEYRADEWYDDRDRNDISDEEYVDDLFDSFSRS